MQKRFYTVKELSQLIDVHPQTLARWRRERTGPPYVKLNGLKQIRYWVSDVEVWMGAEEPEAA